MKKTTLAFALASTSIMSTGLTHAGNMGVVEAVASHEIAPFVSAEGFPIWINFGGLRLNNNGATSSADTGNYLSGGARVAGGFSYSYSPTIDFSMETGWNYIGSTSGELNGNQFGATLSGADLLVGASYKLTKTEWFVKAGTLFERNFVKFSVPNYTYVLTSGTSDVYAKTTARLVVSDILPEIKVGGVYNYSDALGITVSYMHAFGQTPYFNGSISSTSTTIYDSFSTTLRGPSLNAVMAGIRYQFV